MTQQSSSLPSDPVWDYEGAYGEGPVGFLAKLRAMESLARLRRLLPSQRLKLAEARSAWAAYQKERWKPAPPIGCPTLRCKCFERIANEYMRRTGKDAAQISSAEVIAENWEEFRTHGCSGRVYDADGHGTDVPGIGCVISMVTMPPNRILGRHEAEALVHMIEPKEQRASATHSKHNRSSSGGEPRKGSDVTPRRGVSDDDQPSLF